MNFPGSAGEHDSAVCVIDSRNCLTFGEVISDPFALRNLVNFGETVFLQTTETSEILSAFVVLEGWASTIHLLPPELHLDQLPGKLLTMRDFTKRAPESRRRIDSYELPREIVSRWVIYTSGTAGIPKPVTHSLKTLSRTVKRKLTANELVWGQIYDPNRMAGIQVIMQGLVSRQRIVGMSSNAPLNDKIVWLRANDVSALSATPTIWRQILQAPAAEGWNLKQLTLGGEIADQKILDSLALAFPNARLTHIFASTETGAAFAVSDGLAGFPRQYLETPPQGIPLQIRDGMLFVFNPGMADADSQGFVPTGDAVAMVEDRVLYLGRNTGVVNVGGGKVWPEEVENILRAHPLVQDAIVVSQKNPISGSILIASVVPSGDVPEDFIGQLRRWVREKAPNYYVPAMIKLVSEIRTSEVGKAKREWS